MADRVGIIREGRLVAVEGVRALHSRRVRRFEIRFADGVPRDALERLQGIRELHVDGPVARLLLDGAPIASSRSSRTTPSST